MNRHRDPFYLAFFIVFCITSPVWVVLLAGLINELV